MDVGSTMIAGPESQAPEPSSLRSTIANGVHSPAANEYASTTLRRAHAALETGLDADRKQAVAATAPDAWRRGVRVNEALATWIEIHLARDDGPLSNVIWTYVRAGQYPSWPYCGAELVEQVFDRGGIDGVRGLISRFRSDPDGAAAELDALG